MLPITSEVASACWDAIKDAPESDEESARVHRANYEECAVRVRGWVLVPYIDAGDWDYVNSVISPDGVEYEVKPGPPIDEAGDTAENRIFNWWPRIDRGDSTCCRGYLKGKCW